MWKMRDELQQLEYVMTVIKAVILIFLQCARKTGLILHGSFCVHVFLLCLFFLTVLL